MKNSGLLKLSFVTVILFIIGYVFLKDVNPTQVSKHKNTDNDKLSTLSSKPDEKIIDGWKVDCTKGKTELPYCEASITNILHVDNEQESNVKIISGITKYPEGYKMTFLIPLGVNLRDGLILETSPSEKIKLSFNTCFKGGCLASAEVKNKQKEEFNKIKKIQLSFRTMNGNGIKYNLSLSNVIQYFEENINA